MFHYKARENFNTKALEIVSLIEEAQVKQPALKERVGSFAQKNIEDWSGKIDKAEEIIISTIDRTTNEKTCLERSKKGKVKSLSGENFNKLISLVNMIHKLESTNTKVEKEFVLETSFSWILDTSDNGYSIDYCTFLETCVKKEIDDFVVKYEILYLDINRSFQLGDVSIEYITKDFFETLIKKKSKERKTDDIESLRNNLLGKVYASTIIEGCSLETARRIAYEKCCFAVDVIKFYSETVHFPQIRLDFDLDTRVNFHISSMSISHEVNDKSALKLQASSSGVERYTLNDEMIDAIQEQQWFFKVLDNNSNNEIKLLLKKSISSYAHALSNKNIHKRIVELCSIWESLLLKGNTSNIKESLINYGSKILEPNIERRNQLKKIISSIYDIRSKYIHHAKESEIDYTDLTEFQRRTVLLFEIYERISSCHKTKIEFLEDIDNFIDKSFNPWIYLDSKQNQ